jgi:hypothetical protein
MKLYLLITLLISTLQADFMLGSKSWCIDEYYTKKGTFYYHRIKNDRWYNTTSKSYTRYIVGGYTYDTTTEQCNPDPYIFLGMQSQDYYFLLALSGVLFGSLIFYILANFLIGI